MGDVEEAEAESDHGTGDAMMKPLLALSSMASSRNGGAGLNIFIFHRVLREPDPLLPSEPHAAQFDAICGWLKSWFNVLPLQDAVQQLQRGSLPSRAVAVTFDDGYADNFEVAAPILQRHGLPATVFVATGFLDGGSMWNDGIIEAIRGAEVPELEMAGPSEGLLEGRVGVASLEQKRAAMAWLLPRAKYMPLARRASFAGRLMEHAQVRRPVGLMMTSEQVRRLPQFGVQVGAHTVNHPILSGLDADASLVEIRDSKRELERIVGAPIPLFAYPNGKLGDDYQALHVEQVRDAGFTAALSTHGGVARASSDMFQLPRFTPWERTRLRFGLSMARHLVTA